MTQRSFSLFRPFSKVGTDILKLSLAAAGVQGIALVALPFLQRFFYSPEAFADFTLYSQLAGILGAIATARMDLAVVQHNGERLARAALHNGLHVLCFTTGIALLLALGLNWGGFQMGQVPGLWFGLPLGVASLGIGALASSWLTRDQAFGTLARYRTAGGAAGEALRFAFVGLGHVGLIAGRVAGQWLTAVLAWRACQKEQTRGIRPSRDERRAAWSMDRDYLRFTTPSNLLSMAANACLVFFLFEYATRDFVGQVGTALAYLTAASGLVIRSVNDVFFRHLKDIEPQKLPSLYLKWALGLTSLTAVGCAILHAIPGSLVSQLLGDQWSAMLPAMKWLSLWMMPWVAASSLSGVFPHLRRQALAFGLDVGHLLLLSFWLWLNWSHVGQESISSIGMDILKEYAMIQGGFYAIALVVGWRICKIGVRH